MNKGFKHIIALVVLLFGISSYMLKSDATIFSESLAKPDQPQILQDTVPETRYPVAKTKPEEYEDLNKQSPVDLRDPDNLQIIIEYDIHTGMYIIRTKIGDLELGTPITLTPEEYQDYSMQESMREYYRQKNEENYREELSGKFNLADMQFNIGAADKIFGPGGVRVKSQGSAELTMGLKTTKTKNPSLPERSRNRTFFNFDNNVQLNMQANVGTKVNFNLNYNTQSSFDFDASRLKLAYSGEEDEIIKTLEAGNVSLNTSNSLIRGGAALFGIKTELQFGKLRVNALLAQQNSESHTINTKGGAQTHDFEITIDQYDEDRHFFLAYYFRDQYDNALKKLPYITSGVKINRIEVWITNKRSNYNQARNIVAFSDLAEFDHISNTQFHKQGDKKVPYNEANNLYTTINDEYKDARDISKVERTFNGFIESGRDYEEVESARKLEYSEYIINDQLGYISLNAKLQADEVLAVAYEYTYGGNVYQVGEFSTDKTENTKECLFLKLLKGTVPSPSMPYWDLMMKNIYSLNAYSVQSDRFRLDILFQSDTTGTYINYIPEGKIANKPLIQVMNLDRLDSNNEPYPNGFFDYVEGYTIISSNGRVIFPVVEPFGEHLKDAIGGSLADKYVFQELYDSTKTVAQQIAEKNKFILRGEYKASSGSEIVLGATNVARGSVIVTAGAATLTENVDYTVDYVSGIVNIINENVISSNTPIRVSMENQSMYSMQRKTMMGLDLNYEFSKNLTVGGTIMHLSEMPLTTKTTIGEESIKNTLWGANVAYQGESQWLTNLFDNIPLLNLTTPSRINFNAEFAHLIAGHYESKYTGAHSYLDDFESTQSNFDLLNPYPWALASTPYDKFEEATRINDIEYGKNRSLFAWYYIDGFLNRKNSKRRPDYFTDDSISDPYVRAVEYKELFPGKDNAYNESSLLYVLNLAYYPSERGPYNLDADDVNPDGSLLYPEKRWGGMMRKLDQTDFEQANIEYIEFWMMDPFIKNKETATGGDLYFNLGNLSEDVLKDEKKFFENGLPVNGDMSLVDTTVWGRVPNQQSTVYAFDNSSSDARRLQDVGFDGLSSNDEKDFGEYKIFREKLSNKLDPGVREKMERDRYSPLNDPASDDFRHFRSGEYDATQAGILERYKRYNGTEGNSQSAGSSDSYDMAAKMVPDVEDLNQDNTLNKNERYFEYKISIRPADTVIGQNYIVNKREIKDLSLPNGNPANVTWYQFKIPVKEYLRSVGGLQDFKTIRFMRVYMTGFKEPTIIRLGSFSLVRGEWRTYEQNLASPNVVPSNGQLDVTSVNYEEDKDRKPINYLVPPGVSRMVDPNQSQIVQQNEQALSLKVTNLGSQDARAIYKTTYYDMRRYKRLQLFVHAESLIDNISNLSDGDISVFLRLGSDYTKNYYEYEVPLTLTPPPPGERYTEGDRDIVWKPENMLDFKLELLTKLKTERNQKRRSGESGVTFNSVYSKPDENNVNNRVSIIGNPSLAEVKTIMIGIRNNAKDIKSGEVWVNELRLTDFDENGGWAANGTLNVALSDLGTFNATGRVETAGFGGLDQSLSERNMDDYTQYAISTSVQLGKFFPEKARISLPLYYSYSKEVISPKYNPLDQDIVLQEALDAATTKAEKDSIKSLSQDQTTTKSFAMNNINVGIRSKNSMPYDPANFTFSYASSVNTRTNPETEYETTRNHQAGFTYNYTPYVRPFIPFAKLIKKEKSSMQYLKQFSINYLPSNISFQSSLLRNYFEMQTRDLNNINMGQKNPIQATFSEAFYFDRSFSIRWNLLNNLNMDFSSQTNARIEAPHVQVNKKLEPDTFKVWKDAVLKSIRDLGSPLAYDQTLNVTYNLPFQHIPALNWIGSSVAYNATYNWERGSYIDEEVEYGNTIQNQRQINLQASLNLQQLYNKNKFLKKVNQKFNASATAPKRSTTKKKERTKYEGTITLNPDSGVIVTHGLMSKKLIIRARRATDSIIYKLNYKVLDFTRIHVTNQDSIDVKISVYPAPPPEENFWYKVAEQSSRVLMMLRRLNIQYSVSDGMMIPGFQPMIGNWIGQGDTPNGSAPGWRFALGDVRESYIVDAKHKQWLINNPEENITPAMINSSKTFTASATLEPTTGLKIDLNATRLDSRDTEIQYMHDAMPTTYGGTFTMTTVAFGSLFSGVGNANNGYSSKTFNDFLKNREIIAGRLENIYANKVNTYPTNGFMQGNTLAGQPYDPESNHVRPNSSDVLIPAFLAAYTGKDAKKINITAFPSLARLIPNWKVSYDGLIRIPFIKKHFKSMVLNHQYRCVYNVGGYNSYLNWVSGSGNELGFVKSPDGEPLPSSAYEISSVNITESLNPLIGLDATFLNNVTTGVKFQKNRNLNLNISSYQIIETHSNEIVLSIGYKYADFNKVLKMRKKGDFNHDLTVRVDYSQRKNQSLIRKIEGANTQMTQGALVKGLQLSADYAFSKSVSLRAFYDIQINNPLVSSASYPTSNSNYGISMRISLAQ